MNNISIEKQKELDISCRNAAATQKKPCAGRTRVDDGAISVKTAMPPMDFEPALQDRIAAIAG
jgi:hypothetical protein